LLSDTNTSNAVAFPAFENDTYYGMLVVVSGNYDFFENGHAFYESSLVDFTAAVRSAKLYLQMKDMATKDGLTGVYNRAYFNEIYPSICAKCIVNEQSLSVALLDIDKFKSINDTYGHLAGDEVIRMVASVDQKYAQIHNGYAVRYGGEEFLLILQGYSVDEFYVILEEVQEDIIRNIVHYEGEEIHVNASIGMSNYPEIAEEIVDVLDQSDRAMYFSKEKRQI
jgi:diguanylate cyclase (GGDEF)-like protein